MATDIDKDKLIRNEQLVRNRNIKAKNGLKNFFRRDSGVTSTPISFTCECSRLDCTKRVPVSIDAYEAVHGRNDRFLILPGHETDKVEKVVVRKPRYYVVEKFGLNPL